MTDIGRHGPRNTMGLKAQGNYLAGLGAEEQVARLYADHGHRILERRWRGPLGEIDLIAEKGGEVIFIEVKKSSSFARAAEALGPRQIRRLMQSAEHYVGTRPAGSMTPMRFDLALVDGIGRIEIRAGALTA